jgi:hypothetical protein
LATVDAGVDSLGDERAGLIPEFAGFLEADLGIGAQRDAGLLACPGEAEVPVPGPVRADEERQVSAVIQ